MIFYKVSTRETFQGRWKLVYKQLSQLRLLRCNHVSTATRSKKQIHIKWCELLRTLSKTFPSRLNEFMSKTFGVNGFFHNFLGVELTNVYSKSRTEYDTPLNTFVFHFILNNTFSGYCPFLIEFDWFYTNDIVIMC